MGRRMPRLMQVSGSSQFYYRARVPTEIVEQASGNEVLIELPAIDGCVGRIVHLKLSTHVKFSLGTSDRATAERLISFIDGQLAQRYALAIKPPQAISNQNISALAGVIYQKFVDRFLENPGKRTDWVALKAFNRAAREGRLLNPPSIQPFDHPNDGEAARQIFGVNLTEGINEIEPTTSVTALEARFGLLTDWVLETHGFRIDPDSRRTLLERVDQATTLVAQRMKKAADGDYSPDPAADRFPVLKVEPTLTIDDLFDRWKTETKPSPSTLSSWGKPLRLFKEHIGTRPIASIGPKDIVSWKDKLVASDVKPRTINDTYLAAVSRWLQIGLDNHQLSQNSAKGIRVATNGSAEIERRAYTDEEIARLLLLSTASSPETRWLIWLTVATGARIGEIAQLWRTNFMKKGENWFVHIRAAADGGRLKNAGSERTIPLHPKLIEAGFIDFLNTKGTGALFYKRSSGDASKKHASKSVTNRLSAWIRDAGFAGDDIAPCHSIRHWWKTAAHRNGVNPIDADTFQGHSIRGVANTYRHIEPVDLLRVTEVMPFPALSPKPRQEVGEIAVVSVAGCSNRSGGSRDGDAV